MACALFDQAPSEDIADSMLSLLNFCISSVVMTIPIGWPEPAAGLASPHELRLQKASCGTNLNIVQCTINCNGYWQDAQNKGDKRNLTLWQQRSPNLLDRAARVTLAAAVMTSLAARTVTTRTHSPARDKTRRQIRGRPSGGQPRFQGRGTQMAWVSSEARQGLERLPSGLRCGLWGLAATAAVFVYPQ